MAQIPIQHSNVLGGLNPIWYSASAAGDFFGPSSGIQTLEFLNSGTVPVLITVANQHNCNQNYPHPLVYVVPAQTTPFIAGPFDGSIYVDTGGNVDWTYSTTVLPPPGALVAALLSSSYGLGIGGYRYAVTFVNITGETTGGTEVSITTTSGYQAIRLDGIPLGPGGTTARKIYRTPVNGASGAEQFLTTLNDNTTTSFIDSIPDSLLEVAIPTQNTAGVNAPGQVTLAAGAAGNPNGTYRGTVTFVNSSGETLGGVETFITVTNQQINWSGIPLGPSGTTARKLYRTLALAVSDYATMTEQAVVSTGSSQVATTTDGAILTERASVSGAFSAVSPSLTKYSLGFQGFSGTEHLVTTLSDNTTTTFTDNVSDATLGTAALLPSTSTATVLSVAVIAP